MRGLSEFIQCFFSHATLRYRHLTRSFFIEILTKYTPEFTCEGEVDKYVRVVIGEGKVWQK